MKRWLLNVVSALILIYAGTFGPVRVQAQATQPNVMFIIVDDLRPQLGAYGATQMVTPNIDALAASGTLFERAYVMQATCAPSRACMMTGLRPDSTGIYDLETPVRSVMPEVLTLPQHFKNNGYETISIGKVYHHQDDDPQGWSRTPFRSADIGGKKGYQTEAARKIGAANPFGPPYESADVADNAYADGKNTDYAIRVLQEMKGKDKPFFMAMGLHKPHLPFTAPKKYWDLYSPEDIELSLRTNEPDGMSPFSLTTWGELRRWYGMPKGENPMPVDEAKRLIHGYYAAVSYSDAQVGRILAELDRLGMAENTIVVLIGDHGWKLGDYGAWSKHSNFEIDTRVPLIIRTPEAMSGKAKAGLRIDTIVESIDLYPTLSELAGLSMPAHLQGVSLAAVVKDPDAEGKGFAVSQFPRGPADGGNNFVHRAEYGVLDNERLGEGIMGYGLRVDGYRFVEWFALSGNKLYPVKSVLGIDMPTRELYDHQNDPLEKVNVVNDPAYRKIVDQLAVQLRQQLGDKVGEVWFSVPERGQTLAGATSMRIGALQTSYAFVQITLDNKVVFKGTQMPEDLKLRPEELTAGKHSLAVVAVDAAGVTHKQSTEFLIEHVRLSTDAASDKISQAVTLRTALNVPAESIRSATVTLEPALEDKAAVSAVLHSGTSLPSELSFDTLAFADGAYDLVAQLTMNTGVAASAKQRLLIDNWETLEDLLLPPVTSEWFGATDRLEVVERSKGWLFVGDDQNTLFGDSSRMKLGQSNEEHLTWKMTKLHDFTFTLYTRNLLLSGLVQVDVSVDGNSWTSAPYATTAGERSGEWISVRLEGDVAPAIGAQFIRLTLQKGNQANDAELGNVWLRGAK